jgi:23S rRNA pseudouridine2605 synthase
MPPRFAYWTIILDGTPTSFRTKEREEILPLFNQLKAKNPMALLKWFSGGTLWDSPEQAREAREREKVRAFRDERTREAKALREGAADPLAEFRKQHGRPADGSDQKPPQSVDRGPAASAPRGDRPPGDRPWSDRARTNEPRWSPGVSPRPGSGRAAPGPPDPLAEFRKQHGRPADGSDQQRPDAPGRGPGFTPRREGRPPSDRRGKDWRPGGDHRDPADKYKLPPGEARKRWKERNLRGPKPPGSTRDGGRGFSLDGPAKPGGDRPWGDRPRGPKPFGSKPGGKRPWSPGSSEPGAPRERKPFGSKPAGDRPWGDRPRGPKPFGSKPGGDRPWGGKPRGPKPPGSTRNGGRGFSLDKPARPGGRPFGAKPRGPKPFGSKPGGRPFGAKPRGKK